MPNITINGKDIVLREIEEVEHHIHNREHWFGLNAVETSLVPYQLSSGNALYGAEVLLIDTGDIPIIAGNIKYDPHRIYVVDYGNNTLYYIQLVWGTGTFADALAAGQESEFPTAASAAGVAQGTPINILMPRLLSGTKIWARVKNTTNLATIDILIGVHEYDQ